METKSIRGKRRHITTHQSNRLRRSRVLPQRSLMIKIHRRRTIHDIIALPMYMRAVKSHARKELFTVVPPCNNTPRRQVKGGLQILKIRLRIQFNLEYVSAALISILNTLNNGRNLRKEGRANTNVKAISTNENPM